MDKAWCWIGILLLIFEETIKFLTFKISCKTTTNTAQIQFLVSGRGIASQQEFSLILAKPPSPIYYETVMDSPFSIYAG